MANGKKHPVYTIEEYEKLPYDHLFHDLTPLLMGTILTNSWCNDCKIIVTPDNQNRYIPNDRVNFEYGYVKRPKIKKSDMVKPLNN